MHHGQRKEVTRYVPNLQNNEFVVLHIVDGCWQPPDDARVKSSVGRPPRSKGQLHARGTSLRRLLQHTGMGTQW